MAVAAGIWLGTAALGYGLALRQYARLGVNRTISEKEQQRPIQGILEYVRFGWSGVKFKLTNSSTEYTIPGDFLAVGDAKERARARLKPGNAVWFKTSPRDQTVIGIETHTPTLQPVLLFTESNSALLARTSRFAWRGLAFALGGALLVACALGTAFFQLVAGRLRASA